MEEAAGNSTLADAFEQVEGAVGDGAESLERLDEGVGDRGLAGEVVDFVGVGGVEDLAYAGAVGHPAGNESDAACDSEGFEIMVFGLEFAGGTPDAVAFAEQELCEIGSVLAGDAED